MSIQRPAPLPAPLQVDIGPSGPDEYVVGRDPGGFWVAVETHGRAGGVFCSREAACDYAEFETARRPNAVHVTSEPVTLRM